MEFLETQFPGVILIKPDIFVDSRGFFLESYRAEACLANEINCNFIQDNHSRSSKGVIRGMHFQLPPFAQAKLIRVARGKALDVILDLRKGSPTFGQAMKIELSDENHQQVFVPAGFAHGFQVLSDEVDFLYKVDIPYTPEADAGINWQDPHVADLWYELDVEPEVSEKDLKLPNWDVEKIIFAEEIE